jgi:ATP-dependent helicase HrpB
LLGAIDDEGAVTARGREIAALPMEPRLAAMIVGAPTGADRALAAEIAALIGERGLGGDSTDLRDRIERFRKDGSPRAKALRDQAARWAKGAAPARPTDAGRVVAADSPNSIARAIAGEPGRYLLTSGRAVALDKGDALANSTWLAVADFVGAAASSRILAAAPISESDALALGNVETTEIATFDADRRAVRARRVKRLGAMVLSETPLPAPSGDRARAALIDAVKTCGLFLLDHGDAVADAIARIALARSFFGDDWPAIRERDLIDRAEEWLAPLLGDPPSLSRPTADQLRRGVLSLIDWKLQRTLDEIAPTHVAAPTGRNLAIDYRVEGGPMIEARVQEFYGLSAHPTILRGRLPLSVSLLSPARRQIALTKNLPAFWSGGYRDMAKDMRGEYPKHDWPNDPASASAHAGKTKARLKRDG